MRMVIGSLLGLLAGYRGDWAGVILLRLADAIMSFPSMLLAVIVLFVFEPGVTNVILVLAVSRIPILLRVVRAEVLEVKEHLFVSAARAMGAKTPRILLLHIAPMILPTVINLAALEMAFVMLVESGLSFLGIGIQPPEVTCGLMVADGRNYLGSVWWLAFWPGLAIILVTMSLNLLSNWLRVATDPVERWRLHNQAGNWKWQARYSRLNRCCLSGTFRFPCPPDRASCMPWTMSVGPWLPVKRWPFLAKADRPSRFPPRR